MIGNILGGDGLIVVILAVVVLFGGSQLPKLAKNVGSAGREFRKAQAEAEAHVVAPHSLAAMPAPVAVPGVAALDSDQVVISRSELRHELADLLEQRRQPTEP
jgi:sec-independent protein translocase protein TatA